MISRRPHQKIGIEKPVSEMPITVWSRIEPRLTAARMPAGMPIASASAMANTDSSTVAGNRAKNSPSTGLRVTIELPRSPWSRLPRKPRYCSTSGRSKPYWAIIWAWRSGLMPRSPTISRTGSPGDQADQDEGDEGDAQEGRDQDGQPRAEEAEHVSGPANMPGSQDAAPGSFLPRTFEPGWTRSNGRPA